MNSTNVIWAHFLVAMAMLFGGGSLLVLGLFLFVGSWQLFDLGLGSIGILIWDVGLALVFCLQHSLMIRQGFRERLRKLMPDIYHPTVFAWASGVALFLLLGLWQQATDIVWSFGGIWMVVIRGINALTVVGFLWGTGALESLDTFGHLSLLDRVRGKMPTAAGLHIQGPYRWVRHPLYFFVLLLLWICPECTLDRFLLNGTWTVWIIIGSILEERDLVAEFGSPYRAYQREVPMLIPRPPKTRNAG